MSNNHSGKSGKLALAKQLVAGTNKHFSNPSEQLEFGGTTRTVAEVLKILQDFIGLREGVVVAQATSKAKVAAERAQGPALLVIIDEFIAFLRARLGSAPDGLVDFGLEAHREPAHRTAEQKAVAAAKAKATREARGTRGKVAKRSVKGAVQAALVVTPVAAPQPAAAPPAPAAAPSGGGSPPHGQ
jgi:hypothetical protein